MSCPFVPAGGALSQQGKAIPIMHQYKPEVIGGVDTHLETHVAAVINTNGQILGTGSFPATLRGYQQLVRWMNGHGEIQDIGIEGTGSYGMGLIRFCHERGVGVQEVNRPDRQRRRRLGKSDTVDAESAARAVLAGDGTAIPKTANGTSEALRALKVARRSAMKQRTQVELQIRDLIVTAPDDLRQVLQSLKTSARVGKCARFHSEPALCPRSATKTALRCLARRHQHISEEIDTLDVQMLELCKRANRALLGARCVGPQAAAALLIAAGDNPDRLHSEASFAALTGTSPVQASSGRLSRHRLNRGGNRQANEAIYHIVKVRTSHDPATKAYLERRTTEGKTKPEAFRSLKRYVAREVFNLITNPPVVPHGADLRALRKTLKITGSHVARVFAVDPNKVSRIERELDFDNDFSKRYQQWLTDQKDTLPVAA